MAALTFEPGEPLRSGWLLLAASYLVLVPGRIRLGPSASGLAAMVERTPWVNALTSVASGALAVTGFLLLSRAWRASGLDTTSRSGRVVGLDGRTVRVVEEVFRTLGACFAFAAGMAQRWVMKERE